MRKFPETILTEKAFKFWIKNIPVKLSDEDWDSVFEYIDVVNQRDMALEYIQGLTESLITEALTKTKN